MARLPAGPLNPEVEEGTKLYELSKDCLGTDEPDPYSRQATLSPALTKAVYYSYSNLRNSSVLQPRLFEAIGITVGRELECSYLVETHGRALEQLVGKSSLEELEPNERSVLQLVPRFVKDPASFTDKEIDRLRAAGYKDPEILQILATMGAFVMNATVALALGLE